MSGSTTVTTERKIAGRLNELARCPSKAKLNEKRSYAQVKQGRRKKLWKQRIAASREWVKASRRSLDIQLDLKLISPQQPEDMPTEIVEATGVTATVDDREILSRVSVCVRRKERVLVSGRNGAGKTTLLSLLAHQRQPNRGRVVGDPSRIGMIAQGAANWHSDQGLIANLQTVSDASLEDVAEILTAHRFPFALAQRPLRSLSPGECVRAALICLYHRSPTIELLMLDEPTVGLDFVGSAALRDALKRWSGAMILVCHDRDFIDSIGIDREIRLDGPRTSFGPARAPGCTDRRPLL